MAFSISPAEFFSALHATGTAGVTREDMTGASGEAALRRAFDETLENYPGEVEDLEWSPFLAAETLRFFYKLCQALVDRAMADEEVTELFSSIPTMPETAGEFLSIDLTLRHLPELHIMAKSMNSSDPLVAGLEEMARRFPFSSVGIPLHEPLPELSILQRHSGLWRLYIDRVIERQDASRLADEAVKFAVIDTLGAHALPFAPKLAAHLALTSPPIHPLADETQPNSLS